MSQDQFPQQFPPAAGQMPAAPAPYAEPPKTPGRGLGIAGLVLGILVFPSLIGLILSIVGFVQAKKAGRRNGIALAGIIVSALTLIGLIIFVVMTLVLAGQMVEACKGQPDGAIVLVNGLSVTCGG